MITIDLKARGIAAIGDDEDSAKYDSFDHLETTQPAAASTDAAPSVRALVEVQRRFGGLAPRAVLGGEFRVGSGNQTFFVVHVGEPFDRPRSALVTSRLWKKPFLAGLPEEFGQAVLDGVAGPAEMRLPGGRLTVDRAGFDEVESSAAIFTQAASLLRCVIGAELYECDVEAAVRRLIAGW